MNNSNRMKQLGHIAAAAALALAVVAPIHAQQSRTAATPVMIEGVGVMELARVSASIEAIDLKNRIVTLRGPRGNVFAIALGDRVKNLAQVKVGDVLEVDYYESIAIEVSKSAGKPSVTSVELAVKAKPGQKPGGMALRKVRIVTNVVGINTESQSVLVRGPLGHLTQVKLRDPKVLASLETGGQIDLTYVEGVAISVQGTAAKI